MLDRTLHCFLYSQTGFIGDLDVEKDKVGRENEKSVDMRDKDGEELFRFRILSSRLLSSTLPHFSFSHFFRSLSSFGSLSLS